MSGADGHVWALLADANAEIKRLRDALNAQRRRAERWILRAERAGVKVGRARNKPPARRAR